jgi:hypothetical protein
MRPPPDNYSYLDLQPVGSNVTRIRVLVCKRCGNIVGGVYTHEQWHKNNESPNDICLVDSYTRDWHTVNGFSPTCVFRRS